jgi:hypothetical protein
MLTTARSLATPSPRRAFALQAPRSRPLPRPLRFKEEERREREEKVRREQEALNEAREKRAKAQQEAKDAIEDAAAAVKKAAESTTTPPIKPRPPTPPETSLVKSIPFYVPAFTRYKEIAVGRVAMAAMAASAALEVARPGHPGSLQQIAQNFGWPLPTVELALGVFVLHGLLGLWPSSPTYSETNARDFLRRTPGPPSVLVNPLRHPARFFGVQPFEWGFTKRNELLHGRIAMLAFLGSCAAEIKTGGLGTIGQAAFWLGKAGVDVGVGAGGVMPALPAEGWYAQAAGALLAWSVFCFLLAYARGSTGETEGGGDVY